MTVTVSLVGAQDPPLVQIVVSAAPSGEAWTLRGEANGYSWTVPGGAGVGSGDPVVRVDNRTPGNVPVIYRFASSSADEESVPITVPIEGDIALQSLDGQRGFSTRLLEGSLDLSMRGRSAFFDIPNRARPVVRYSVTSDDEGVLRVAVPFGLTDSLKSLARPGEPILVRCGTDLLDLPPVFVAAIPSWPSTAYPWAGVRVWEIPYRVVDDPYLDRPLGAFSWNFFDSIWSGLAWNDFDAALGGLTWDEFDTLDWTTL